MNIYNHNYRLILMAKETGIKRDSHYFFSLFLDTLILINDENG